MRVNSINNSYYRQNSPNFKNWDRTVYKPTFIANAADEVLHRNTTNFFRPSLTYWKDLVSFVNNRFKNVPKVNVYDYGCSDGSEIYSFIVTALSILNDKYANKFFPIIAKDYDPVAIEKCLSRNICISDNEMAALMKLLKDYSGKNNYFNDCFKFLSEGKNGVMKKQNGYVCFVRDSEFIVQEPLFNKAKFSVADIREDYVNIEPENSIVFARNFWPYLSEEDRRNMAHNLYKQLKGNSILVLGNFDGCCEYNGTNMFEVLQDNGFKKSEIRNIFVKEL